MGYSVCMVRDGKSNVWGNHRTLDKAEAHAVEARKRVAQYGWDDAVIEITEFTYTGDFVEPSKPIPRERFIAETGPIHKEDAWPSRHVKIIDTANDDLVVFEYDRNYMMYDTFEPFRQGGRHYALISPDYTATTVVDLDAGEIVASEEPDSFGFCPVGFYVPDWWDVHDGRSIPGGPHWDAADEWPVGTVGFVWGCVWGDDLSWKLQTLDLSEITDGKIGRSDPFDYFEMWSDGGQKLHELVSIYPATDDNGDVQLSIAVPKLSWFKLTGNGEQRPTV